tara:strand:+ start:280 stop:768 length:489 start_codon:yes stop_codon:yes gene_type:complete
MHPNDHHKLFYLTIAMDVPFIAILLTPNLTSTPTLTLTTYDTIYCYIVLFIHAVFLVSMHYNITELLEFLHYIVFILLSAGIGASNVFILSICLFLSTAIQVLWVYEERCILNERTQTSSTSSTPTPSQFGYGKELNVYMILLTIFFSMKIGSVNNWCELHP